MTPLVAIYLVLIAHSAALAAGEPACESATGSCFEPHGNPGCDVQACCELICEEVDPFCCEALWDGNCAGQALKLCDGSVTCPGQGDCYEAHAGPGCVDPQCCQEVCEQLPECCQFEWTGECAEAALEECPCGAPNSGDCSEANETPGCEGGACCSTVCTMDGFCCSSGWDDVCLEEGAQFCGLPACDLQCPAGALSEGEHCGERINGGCNVDDPGDPKNPAFTPINCGDTFCGKAFAHAARDTDWYEATVNEPTQLNWSVASEFPASVIIVEGDCETHFVALAESFTTDCAVATTSVCVQPGTYYLFVSPAIELRSMRAGAPCPSCPADFDGNGVIDAADLAQLLVSWGACDEDCPEDLKDQGDGLVDSADLAELLVAWGICEQPPDAIWGNDYLATLTCQPCSG